MNEKKKRCLGIIILLLLLFFIGLIIFLCVKNNDKDSSKKANLKTPTTTKVSKTKKDKTDTETNDSNIEPATNSNNFIQAYSYLNSSSDKIKDNIIIDVDLSQNNNTTSTDNSYAKALQLLKKAESSYDQGDYEKAKEAIEKLPKNDNSQSLKDRLDVIEEGLDLEKLVDILVQMVNDRASKGDMTNARTNESDNNITDRVEKFKANKYLKEKLESKLNSIIPLLEDYESPEININNGSKLNNGEESFIKEGILNVSDDNDVYIKINDEEETDINKEDGFILPSKDGKYTITVRDSAYNEITIAITIDTTAPKFKKLKNGHYYDVNELNIDVDDANLDSITVYSYKTGETKTVDNNSKLIEESIYKLTATDKAGNKTEIYVAIDRTAPVFMNVKNGHSYNENKALEIEDLRLKQVDVYNYKTKETRTYTFEELFNGTKVELDSDATYAVTATDFAGHSTKLYVTIDKTPAEIYVGAPDGSSQIVNDGMIYTNDPNINVYDDNKFTFIVKNANGDIVADNLRNREEKNKNGKYFFRSKVNGAREDGKYTIEVKDTSGNVSTLTYILDTKAPVITLKKYTKDNKGKVVEANGYYTYSIVAYIEDNNIDEIKLDGKDYIPGTKISERKTHKLVATDKAGNETTVEFTIDKNYPLVYLNGKKNEKLKTEVQYFNKDVEVKVKDANLDKVVVTKDSEDVTFEEGMKLTEEGTYKIVAIDKSKLKTEVNLVIDKTNPKVWIGDKENSANKIDGIAYTNGNANTNVHDTNPFEFSIIDESGTIIKNLSYRYAPGEWYNNKDYAFRSGISHLIEENKKYTIKATDKAGNTTEYKFVWDKTAPTIKLDKLENEFTNDKDLTITDSNKFTSEVMKEDKIVKSNIQSDLKADGTYYDRYGVWSGDGKYTITATDVAGNKSTIEFTYDTTGPETTGKGTINDNKEVNFVNGGKYQKLELTFTDEGFGNGLSGGKIIVKKVQDGKTLNSTTFIGGKKIWTEKYEEEGQYTVIVIDSLGNETTLTFTIDKTSPKITGKGKTNGQEVDFKNGEEKDKVYTELTLTATDSNLASEKQWGKMEIKYTNTSGKTTNTLEMFGTKDQTTISKTFKEEGTYQVTIYDMLGNKSTTTFKIDTSAPNLIIDGTTYTPDTEGIIYTVTKQKSNGSYDGSANFSGEDKISGLAGLLSHDKLVKSFRRTAHSTYVYPITVKDNVGNTHVYKVFIINGSNVSNGIKSGLTKLKDGDEVILPKANITDNLEINANNITITGSNDSKITGNINIKGNNITLKDVNVSNINSDIEITGDNITIEGGSYNVNDNSTNGSQGNGAIRIFNARNISIHNVTTHGGIHLINYQGTTADITNNNINYDYKGNTALVGILITTANKGSYTALDLFKNNKFNMEEQPNSYYVAIQDTNWENIDTIQVGKYVEINTAEELRKISTNPSDYKGKRIVLTNDIDLSGENWTPINAWSGVLDGTVIDGNNHSIKNMTVVVDTESDAVAGFIGKNASSVTLKNLVFDNAQVTTTTNSNSYAGVLIGKTYSTMTIENVIVQNSKVENHWQAGGLVGFAEGNGPTFINCSIKDSYVGGKKATAGTLFGLGKVDITVDGCTAENIELYTDGLTFESTQKKEKNYWVGHLYDKNLTVKNSTEKDIKIINDTDSNIDEEALEEESLEMLNNLSQMVETREYTMNNQLLNSEYYSNSTTVEAKKSLSNKQHYIIWFAEFKCDPTKCEGFDGHFSQDKVNSVIEGRRGNIETIEMQAPQALNGYMFVGWKQYETEYSEIKFYGYEAIYVKDEPVVDSSSQTYETPSVKEQEETTSPKASIELPKVRISANEFSYDEEDYTTTTTEFFSTEETITVKSAYDQGYNDFINNGYKPENVIWWAQFSCDEEMCEGFNERGSNAKKSVIIEGRRGDIESYTMKAPKAKDGYKFVGWKKSIVKYSELEIPGFEAIYEAE